MSSATRPSPLVYYFHSDSSIRHTLIITSIDPPTQGPVNYDIKFLARHQVGTLVKALSGFIVSTNALLYNYYVTQKCAIGA